MLRLRDLSIRAKLITVIVTTSIITLGIATMAFLYNDQSSAKERLVRDVSMLADILADNCISAVSFDDAGSAEEVLRSINRNQSIEWALITLPDGERFAVYAAEGRTAPKQPPAVPVGEQLFSDDAFVVAKAIRQDGETIGMIYVESNLNELTDRLYWFLQIGAFVMLASSLIGLLIAYYFQRTISRPIQQLATDAEAVSEGKLDLTISYESKDEIGQLTRTFGSLVEYLRSLADAATAIAQRNLTIKVQPRSEEDVLGNAFRSMVFNLIGMITKLQDSAVQLASAASEITSSAEQMARGAKDQADQVAQVSSAVEQMTATIVESAKHANQANDASRQASETAGTGGEVVNETVSGMQRIADVVRSSSESIGKLATSADEIGKIINVIDDIADQTNLLALNAAIEAARAGEQGRGFAVVADEVRKLAERTGTATSEITTMIKGIQTETAEAVGSMESGIKEVDAGRELADQAGNSLSEIVSMSQQVMTMIQQIATASDEQSSAAEEISRTIDTVNTITKETANGVEQSASAAEELNKQAESLKELVNSFQLNH